jgi:hypothetical protein
MAESIKKSKIFERWQIAFTFIPDEVGWDDLEGKRLVIIPT